MWPSDIKLSSLGDSSLPPPTLIQEHLHKVSELVHKWSCGCEPGVGSPTFTYVPPLHMRGCPSQEEISPACWLWASVPVVCFSRIYIPLASHLAIMDLVLIICLVFPVSILLRTTWFPQVGVWLLFLRHCFPFG